MNEQELERLRGKKRLWHVLHPREGNVSFCKFCPHRNTPEWCLRNPRLVYIFDKDEIKLHKGYLSDVKETCNCAEWVRYV
jgi:hypothetical protein